MQMPFCEYVFLEFLLLQPLLSCYALAAHISCYCCNSAENHLDAELIIAVNALPHDTVLIRQYELTFLPDVSFRIANSFQIGQSKGAVAVLLQGISAFHYFF